MFKKTAFIIIIILCISFIAGASSNLPIYECTYAKTRTITKSIELAGEVQPRTVGLVSASINGIIDTVCLNEFSHVKKGQCIAMIDNTLYIDEISRLTMEAEKAKSKYLEAFSSGNASTGKELAFELAFNGGLDINTYNHMLNSSEHYPLNNTSMPNENSTQAEYELKISEMQRKIDQCSLNSPIDGMITELYVKKGSAVQAGQVIGTVADTGKLIIAALASEDELQYIKENMTVSYNVAGSNLTGIGTIGRIYEAFIEDETKERKIPVEIEPSESSELIIGATAEITIVTDKIDNATVLPIGCILSGNKIYVVSDDGKLEERRVKTGISNGRYIELSQGIIPGERVVSKPEIGIEEVSEIIIEEKQ